MICYHIVKKYFFRNNKLSFRNGLEFNVELMLMLYIFGVKSTKVESSYGIALKHL